MGVLGLWGLLDPVGKPVPVETLEGKILAIDVSIWIHQVLQGYQDRRGDSTPNAHLLGLFNRICKLLYFKIKPVFVFDGGVPMLKKSTIVSRKKQKSIAVSKAQKLRNDLMNNLMKRIVVNNVLEKRNLQTQSDLSKETSRKFAKSSTINDLYKLPEQPSTSQTQADDFISDYESDSDFSDEISTKKQLKWVGNIHSVDVDSNEFKSLPPDVRYDILTDLKETRKQNSWARIHEMPQAITDFSSYQMKRLLKRRLVQESLETAEKEMGGKTLTLRELDKLLTDQGINTSDHDDHTYRIASDVTSRVIFVNEKNSTQREEIINTSEVSNSDVDSNSNSNDTLISTQCDFASCVKSNDSLSLLKNIYEYDFEDDVDSDLEIISELESKRSIRRSSGMETVVKYISEYSSLPQEQIFAFVESNKKVKPKLSKTLKKSKNSERKKNKTKKKADDALDETNILPSLDRSDETDVQKEVTDEEKEDLTDTTNIMLERDESVDSNLDSASVEDLNSSIRETISTIEKSQSDAQEAKIIKEIEVKSISSDSDSDFIPVEDVFIPEITSVEEKEKSNIQIILNPEKTGNIEDNLFADIFHVEDIKEQSFSTEVISDDESVEDRNLDLENLEDGSNINEKMDEIQFNKVQPSVSEEESSVFPSSNFTYSESVETSELNSIEASLSSSHTSNSIPLPVSKEDLISMKDKLEMEERDIEKDIGKLERQAMDVTDQIRSEVQELLRLFGIPFIIAPMEAEAQCAHLEQINLTDGTITDDSDIWLFGGMCVYKNFFNNNKRVLQFRFCDIEQHFKLTRHQMVQLALLVGSDYTSGLPGIGPVTAMEILAAFPSEGEDLLQGLMNFSKWMKSGKTFEPGRSSLRNKLKNVKIEKEFPSQAVVQAYLSPTIDGSKEKFSWAVPNLNLLGDYVKQKFGWTKLKFEEVINPVMKRLLEKKSQKRIDAYFKVQVDQKVVEKNLSKRVQSAVKRLGCKTSQECSEEEDNENDKKKRRKGKVTDKSKKDVNESEPQTENVSQNSEESAEVCDNLLESLVDPLSDDKCLQNSQLTGKSININYSNEEYIPQREKDRKKALENKIRAIEVLNKSRKETNRTEKKKSPGKA